MNEIHYQFCLDINPAMTPKNKLIKNPFNKLFSISGLKGLGLIYGSAIIFHGNVP